MGELGHEELGRTLQAGKCMGLEVCNTGRKAAKSSIWCITVSAPFIWVLPSEPQDFSSVSYFLICNHINIFILIFLESELVLSDVFYFTLLIGCQLVCSVHRVGL